MGQLDEVTAVNNIAGYSTTELLKAQNNNVSATLSKGAYFSVDADGIVKIDILAQDGVNITTEVKKVLSGILYPVEGVAKLYQYYSALTLGTAKAYDSDGVLHSNAIKIHL